jgi:D-glycero-alpha-D-manno-heptose-7-phosphate kinase
MILIRAPLRVSFGGGGTDLPAYYERHGGFVVSASISRYTYALAEETGDGAGSVASADYGVRFSWTPTRLPPLKAPLALAKAALHELAKRGALDRGLALSLASDVPPGSGLGSSSAMAVALLQALSVANGSPLGKEEAAERACALEIVRLGMPIGKQDQYASAYGGVNAIEFTGEGVCVTPLRMTAATRAALHARLMLFWTGRTHDSASILSGQRHDTNTWPEVVARLHHIKALSGSMRAALETGDLDSFGQLLDTAWQTKRRLSDAITSPTIDEWYAAARRAGALGGKITGAGGGGFLLLCVPPERQRDVRHALAEWGLNEAPFASFDLEGVTQLDRLPRNWRLRFAGRRTGRMGSQFSWSA